MPLGKFVLESVSLGDKTAATGSNTIPVAPGNNKYAAALKSKVSAGPSLKRKPALILRSKKLLPNIQATSASHPGLSSPRQTSKLSPQVKSYILPSKRAISSLLPKVAEASPSNWRDQFPKLILHEFLQSPQDHKMNSGSSKFYSHVATKGIKMGSKQLFRSKESLLPSWNKTWTMPEDCYISDSPWATLGPEPFPEDTRTTFLITFHALSDKPQTQTLPGLPRAMAYAKSPLFT